MLLHNSHVIPRNKDAIVRELLSKDDQSVLFLNSKLEVIKFNDFASKQYNIDALTDRSFLAFSAKHALCNECQFAIDIADPIKVMLSDRLNNDTYKSGKKIVWHVEYFPELFDTDFKLGLLDITDKDAQKPASNIYCQSVFETVSTMVQNIASESNFTTVLASIIHALPGRAHIKRADDFTYMMTNTATLKLLGMQQAQQLIGLDDYQVSKHMEKRWPGQLAQQLQEMDYSILSTNTPLIGKEEMPYLDADGNLVIHALTKIPLCDLNNQPFGILTLAIDTTHLKDIMFLKNAYLNLYDKPRDAHLSFIKHLGLDRIHADLADLITIRELECLILFARGFTAKEIGRQLSISNRTVERHFETVKAKFNCNTRSDAISLFLSNFNFYTPGIAGYK